MKHTKAFTLVELLAVIAILMAIILIATKTYQTIMYHAKKEAFKSNAQLILEAANLKKSDDPSFDPLSLSTETMENYLGLKDDNYDLLTMATYNGEYYIYLTGFNKWSGFVACGTQRKMYVYDLADASSCPLGGSAYIVDEVIDSDPGDIDGNGNGTGNGSSRTGNTCTDAMVIESVEDLAYFAKRVNDDAYNYSGKCVKLAYSLNISSKNSYVDYKTTVRGDINGDGVTNGLRKELTSSRGFKQIGDWGTDNERFYGNFLGQTNTIYNLYINRPTNDYIGLFGMLNGTVTNVKLVSANITGQDYTGGIAGGNNSTSGSIGSITETYVSGTVTGRNQVGMTIGRYFSNGGAPKVTSNIVYGNVTGNDYVGGIAGYIYANWTGTNGYASGINKGGTITAAGTNAGRISGNNENSGYGTAPVLQNGLALSAVTVKI